jgi:hypothetical protein
MKRKAVIVLASIVSLAAILAIVHVCVNYGPGIIQSMRRMHGM